MIITLHVAYQNLCTEPLITNGFDLVVKINLNYICPTSFTLNSSTKFHGSLIFLEVKYVERRVKGQDFPSMH